MCARVAQWWSIALPRRGSRVRIPSRAFVFYRAKQLGFALFSKSDFLCYIVYADFVFVHEMEVQMVVTEYSLIGALLRFYPDTIEDFKEVGMNCVGCPSSAKETLGQACNVHSVDVNELIKKLDKRING